ncbi:MAG: methylated-DNA--[protein]-cysteine S-methyltransferase [Paracoccaceae bacterium]
MPTSTLNTKFGRLGLVEEDGAIVSLKWNATDDGVPTDLLRDGIAQLRDYVEGKLEVFDLPLRVIGSEFQRSVCDQIFAIPYGYTKTYGEIAKALGAPAQAVGSACGGNPIPIIIPCHRVMGARGLTGFSGAGGVETKVALLRHEGAAGLLI